MALKLLMPGLLLLLSLLLSGCDTTSRLQLDADPGLLQDDLGIGIKLGQPASEARKLSEAGKSATVIEVLTQEELNQRNPYAEHDPQQDLILAVYEADPGDGSQSSSCLNYDSICRISSYLANPVKSQLTLLGKPVARLNAMQAEELLGEPYERRPANDGQMHLYYYYALPTDNQELHEPRKWALNLVLSFTPDGACYAIALSIETAPVRK